MTCPPGSRRALASIYILSLLCIPSSSAGQWITDGTAVYRGPGNQVVECTVPGGGGVIVCWTDAPSGSADTNVWANSIDLYGRRRWSLNPQGAAVCIAPGAQLEVGAISDGAAGMIACWTDQRDGSGDIYAQRLTWDGSIYPSWITNGVAICTAAGTQRLPAVASDGAGGAFIAWSDGRHAATTGWDLYLQRILDTGAIAEGWPANGVRVGSAQGEQDLHAIAPDGAGGVILAWRDTPAQGGAALRALRFTGAGAVAPGWPAAGAPLAASPAAPAGRLHLIGDGARGAFATWEDVRSGAGSPDVYAQRITSSASIATGWPAEGLPIAAGSGDEERPALCGDGGRGALVSWWQDGGIRLQHVDSLGVAGAGWPPDGGTIVASFVPLQTPTILSGGDGSALLLWADARNGVDRDVYAARVLASGAVAPGWAGGIALCAAGGDQYLASDRPALAPQAAVPDGAGGAIVPWIDQRGGVDADVYAQRVTKDAVVGPSWPPFRCWEYCERNDIERLAPNPTRGRFSVQVTVRLAGEAMLDVYDLQGRALLRRGYTLRAGAGSESLDLDLSGLPAGAYFVAYRLRGVSEIYGHAKVIVAR